MKSFTKIEDNLVVLSLTLKEKYSLLVYLDVDTWRVLRMTINSEQILLVEELEDYIRDFYIYEVSLCKFLASASEGTYLQMPIRNISTVEILEDLLL